MQISIANAILVARLVGRSIVRLGLKMWLGFNKSNILGCELVVNGDFEDGEDSWIFTNATLNLGGAEINNIGLSGNPNAFIQSTDVAVLGSTYKLTYDVLETNGKNLVIEQATNIYLETDTVGVNREVVFEWTKTTAVKLAIKRIVAETKVTIDNIRLQEVAQFVPDKSNNCNEAKLFTGKALSFDGAGDFIDYGDVGISLKTICFWINLDSTSEKVLELSSTHSVEVSSGIVVLNGTWDNSVVYVNNSATTDITNTIWQRVVITTTTAITVNDFQLGRINAVRANGKFIASDLQLYNSTWTTSDVAFDYNNPNHLVTDNPNTTLTLSNLSAYYALSEGSGLITYNSAGLGAELVVNGDFSNGLNDWTIVGTQDANHYMTLNNSELDVYLLTTSPIITLKSDVILTSGNTYKLIVDVTNYTSGSLKIDSGGITNVLVNKLGLNTFIINPTSSGAIIQLYRQSTPVEFTIGSISVKEVSLGTIDGATYVLAEPTIPQLGMVDWAKSTPVADEITLIQAPNNKGFDILGNSLRLREHAFNLGGSGYAEVADDDSLDFGTIAFTIQFWAKPNSIADNMRMVTKGVTGNGQWMISFSSTDNVRVFAKDSNGNQLDTSNNFATLSVNSWAMVTVIVDTPNNKILFYKDNQSTATEDTGASWSGNFNNTKPVVVGDNSSLSSTKFDGLIDDVRIYDRALSSSEVEQNYKAGLPSHKNGSSYSDDYSSDYGF